jgi:hypothetical protein
MWRGYAAAVMDLLMIALTVAFFLLAAALVKWLDWI